MPGGETRPVFYVQAPWRYETGSLPVHKQNMRCSRMYPPRPAEKIILLGTVIPLDAVIHIQYKSTMACRVARNGFFSSVTALKECWVFLGKRALTTSLASLVAFGFLLVSAHGQTVTYTNQTTFLANVQPGFYLETFNGKTPGTFPPADVFTGNGFTYSAAASPALFYEQLVGGPAGDIVLSTLNGSSTITFTLTSTVTAIGGFFFLTDINGNPVGTGSVTVTLNDGSFLTVTTPTPTSFVGFTSSVPIASLTVTPSASFATVNDFIVGLAVPEPSTYALLAAGVLLLAFRVRARSR